MIDLNAVRLEWHLKKKKDLLSLNPDRLRDVLLTSPLSLYLTHTKTRW